MITHWDEVDANRRERGHIAGSWQALTGYNSITVGVQRIAVDAGRWATPLHLEGSEEEIFYVLSGTGFSYQAEGDEERAFPVGRGDCLVHRALEHAHTIGAGDEELVVLAFGQRHYAANTLLPRAGVSWLGPTWVLQGAPEDHPWAREAAVGAPTWTELSERPACVANLDDVPTAEHQGTTVGYVSRDLGRAVGSERTGSATTSFRRHADEPAARALGRGGNLRRSRGKRHLAALPEPSRGRPGARGVPIRAGSAIARPAGTRRAHGIKAGADGLTLLAYGTRDPNDICHYPRSGKISFRGWA